MAQTVSSGCVSPKLGIPVNLIPCSTIQNSSASSVSASSAARSGGSGFNPLPIEPRSTPGAPWQVTHISSYSPNPCRRASGSAGATPSTDDVRCH